MFAEIVYHGSPHSFDKFSLLKIGSGEGAQVYGWGLYFAQNKVVAEEYRAKLSKPGLLLQGLKVEEWRDIGADKKRVLKEIEYHLAHNVELAEAVFLVKAQFTPAHRSEGIRSAALWAERSFKAGHLTVGEAGCVYEVEIPSDEELMDWDVTLDKQPERVRKVVAQAVKKLKITHKLGATEGWAYYDRIGHELLLNASLENPDMKDSPGLEKRMASEYLLEHGIPGMRYLDQGSRAAGEGTYNYVIWDEARIKLVAKECR